MHTALKTSGGEGAPALVPPPALYHSMDLNMFSQFKLADWGNACCGMSRRAYRLPNQRGWGDRPRRYLLNVAAEEPQVRRG